MSYFDNVLKKQVDEGREGKVVGIPLKGKIGKYVRIMKYMMFLLGGGSGTGKTSYLDEKFILEPFEFINSKDNHGMELDVIYWSMERNEIYKIAKWTCSEMFKRYKVLVDVPDLLGWEKGKINDDLYKKFLSCREYIDSLLENITIYGADNPTGVYNVIVKYAEANGVIHYLKKEDGSYEYTSEGRKIFSHYVPNNPKKVTILVVDHIAKLLRERGYSKKELIDKLSEYLGLARDRYGFVPIMVSQFNRSLSDSQRAKNKQLTPEAEDFKESGNPYEDSDCVISLFNPFKLKVDNDMDYKVNKFVNKSTGHNRYRSIYLLKNTYGIDDVSFGQAFIGECGTFYDLPKPEDFVNNPSLYNKYV